MIVALIGPSGAGKSTLARRLDAAGEVWVVPTYTTRPPRAEERWGSVDHRFCDDSKFDAMLAGGRFAATGALPGLAHRYGLPLLPKCVDRPLLVVARARNVEALHPLGRRVVVYRVESSSVECYGRLVTRATSASELEARTRLHTAEIAAGRRVADRVFINNGPVGDLATAVAAAIRTDWKETS